MKNLRVRKVMLEEGVTQSDLANLIGRSRSYVSMLLCYELAKSEQDNLIKLMRERTNADE